MDWAQCNAMRCSIIAIPFLYVLCSCSTKASTPDAAPTLLDAAAAIADSAPLPDAAPLCPSFCGDVELCEGANKGVDDNCDGVVDEACECSPGEVYPCFKGDPALRSTPGCVDGSMQCGADATWGDCFGGLHAVDQCDQPGNCQAIRTRPFVSIDLRAGTNGFDDDATSDSFSIECPPGISPCPQLSGDNFTPLQSGGYTVRYAKVTPAGSEECEFPLLVGAPGLRVELEWEWDDTLGPATVDLDLRLHKPGDLSPWGGAADCAYDNCTASDYQAFGNGVEWFGNDSWFLDPIFENNTCYFGPRGNGATWQSIAMGCHSPRLDLDNITCEPNVTDPQSNDFCVPENSNIDSPPTDEWMRVAVHYYSNNLQTYDVHPRIKIYCDGRLAGDLGPTGFGTQEVSFAPSFDDGYWLAADILFPSAAGDCTAPACIVRPLHADSVSRDPVFLPTQAKTTFGPDYAPVP
ncbi:MAG: hypothetical protein JKY56_23095 [Kofleriaceae bacterium]|nr:hypothetical protein [Kofleriaceae bacterium]